MNREPCRRNSPRSPKSAWFAALRCRVSGHVPRGPIETAVGVRPVYECERCRSRIVFDHDQGWLTLPPTEPANSPRPDDALRWIADPSYVGNYSESEVIEIYRKWAKGALACEQANSQEQPK